MTEVTLLVNTEDFEKKLEEWFKFASVQGEFGWIEEMATPDALYKAYRMEYELAKRPGYEPWGILRSVWLYGEEGANLANDVEQLYQRGLTGYDLMEELAGVYAQYLREALLSVMSPPLSEYTIMDKEERKRRGESNPNWPPEKIWIDTAETFENISHRILPVGGQ